MPRAPDVEKLRKKKDVKGLIKALAYPGEAMVCVNAVKALGEIGDGRAIPQLVAALDDQDPDVAWLAADALRQFERAAWPSLLSRLIRDGPHSVQLRHRAHCVFWHQSADGYDDLLAALMSALSSFTLPGSTAVAAYEVLHRLRAKG